MLSLPLTVLLNHFAFLCPFFLPIHLCKVNFCSIALKWHKNTYKKLIKICKSMLKGQETKQGFCVQSSEALPDIRLWTSTFKHFWMYLTGFPFPSWSQSIAGLLNMIKNSISSILQATAACILFLLIYFFGHASSTLLCVAFEMYKSAR